MNSSLFLLTTVSTVSLPLLSRSLFTSCRHEHTLWPFLRCLLALILPGLRRQRDTLLLTSPLFDPTYCALLVGREEKGRAGWESKVEKERDARRRGQRTKEGENVRCDFANMKTRHKFTIAKMDIFCFWSQGWFDSIPGLKFWCCYYVSRWERDEEQKERRRRDVWYEFL